MSREHRRSRPLVIAYEPGRAEPQLVPEGTALVLFARRGENVLAEAKSLVAQGRDSELAIQILARISGRLDIPTGPPSPPQQGVQANLFYGDGPEAALLSGLSLPEGERFGVVCLAYTGGDFSPAQFRWEEERLSALDEWLECLVFVRAHVGRAPASGPASALSGLRRDVFLIPQDEEFLCGPLVWAFAAGFIVGVVGYVLVRTASYLPRQMMPLAPKQRSRAWTTPPSAEHLLSAREQDLAEDQWAR